MEKYNLQAYESYKKILRVWQYIWNRELTEKEIREIAPFAFMTGQHIMIEIPEISRNWDI